MKKGSQAVIQFSNVTKAYEYSRYPSLGSAGGSLSKKVDTFIISFLKGALWRRQMTHYKYAVNDLSFKISKGETLGIAGPNGAGKSTILRLIANVTRPTSGTIYKEGKIAPLIELGAGFHDEFRGSENVYLNGVILGMRTKEIKQVFDSIVTFADLWEYIDMPLKKYSSGMIVRLGFSIVVHSSPDILLIDEVLTVGDEDFQQKCYEKIRYLKEEKKVTIVVVSHDIEKLREMADIILVLEEGKIKDRFYPGNTDSKKPPV